MPEPAPQAAKKATPEMPLPLVKPLKPAPAASPKEAWNQTLERLGREEAGIFSLLQRGRYGGYQDGVFTLALPPEESIFADMLNEESRSRVISQLLQQEMGIPVSFRAARQERAQEEDQEALAQENLQLLSRVFGRDKIIVKSDPS